MIRRIYKEALLLMAGAFAAFLLTQPARGAGAEEPLQIVTTIFPEYDWVSRIVEDTPAQDGLTLLLDSGVDLHSYQPSAGDILKISNCDVFIYVGGASDSWVDDALKEAVNEDMVVLNLLELLGSRVREEEIVEGMQAEEEHGHDSDAQEHGHDSDAQEHGHEDGAEEHGSDACEDAHGHGDDGEAPEADEHVWLSLRNADLLTEGIAQALQEADPANADQYAQNASAYREELKALDAGYRAAVDEAEVTTLVFADRFPFRYLTEDYGLDYYAAFAGCSAETEASFETVIFLAQKIDELGLDTVLTIEGSDGRIAQTVVQSTKSRDQQILSLDSMQAMTGRDLAEGETYLSVMEKNLEVLRQAMRCGS